MQKWDYLIAQPEMIKLKDLEIFLSDRGEEGWELVSVTVHHYSPEESSLPEGLNLYTMFFKRPR